MIERKLFMSVRYASSKMYGQLAQISTTGDVCLNMLKSVVSHQPTSITGMENPTQRFREIMSVLVFGAKRLSPMMWYSKKQATSETATYGSEFVAGRTCLEQLVDLQIRCGKNMSRASRRPARIFPISWCSYQ